MTATTNTNLQAATQRLAAALIRHGTTVRADNGSLLNLTKLHDAKVHLHSAYYMDFKPKNLESLAQHLADAAEEADTEDYYSEIDTEDGMAELSTALVYVNAVM